MTPSEAEALLQTLLAREISRAANGNRWVSRREQRALPAALDAVADAIRSDNGKGSRVSTEALVSRSTLELLAALKGRGSDGIRSWFEAFDFATRRFSQVGLPEGGRVDARDGRPDRATVPEGVLEAFDFYYRAEARDFASVALHRGRLDARDVWAVYISNDGDQAVIEVLDGAGVTLEGAPVLEGRLASWDRFPRQSRLAAWLLRLDDPTFESGLSEPDERDAAGQVPTDWSGFTGEIVDGELRGAADLLLSLETVDPVPDTDRTQVYAAFSYLWYVHLMHRADRGITRIRGNGVLRFGSFTRPASSGTALASRRGASSVTYWVADWRDVDDGSYVLYFEADAPRPVLSIVQFDN